MDQPPNKFCPSCGRTYVGDIDVCEDDGERLVILNEEPSLVGRELEGKYTLTDQLGVGGMGTVYLAHQATMDRDVAVKVLKRQFSQNKLAIKRFLREARAASKLAHPNTITVYDFGQTADGLLYMVMERLNGLPLGDILEAEGTLGPERAVHIMAQVCDSLAEAHANGITHRDLKPDNIYVEPKFGNPDHVKVLDFGIAKISDDGVTQATATGMICGTPSYMSPEQAMGKAIDGRSDIYSLGIVLYEALSAERPFEGETAMEVMLKHLNEEVPPLPAAVAPRVPAALVDLLHRMLAKEPGNRPQSCQVLKGELLAAVGQATTGHTASPPAARPSGRPQTADAITSFDKAGILPSQEAGEPKSRKGLIAVAAVLLLALGGLAVFLATRPDEQPAPRAASDQTVPKAALHQPMESAAAAKAESLAAGGEKTDDDEGERAGATVEVDAGATAADTQSAGTEDAGAVAGDALAHAAADAAAVKREVAKPAAPEVTPAEPVAVAPPPAPVVEKIELVIDSEPPRAKIFEGQVLMGFTPATFERVKNSGPAIYTLRLDGYEDAEVRLGTAIGIKLKQPLKKKKVAAQTTAKKKKKKKKTGGGSSKIGTF